MRERKEKNKEVELEGEDCADEERFEDRTQLVSALDVETREQR